MTARHFAPAQPIAVAAQSASGVPHAFRWRGRRERVRRVEAAWEVAEGWWRGAPGATRRGYFRLLTHGGIVCVVYRDLASGCWYLERIFD